MATIICYLIGYLFYQSFYKYLSIPSQFADFNITFYLLNSITFIIIVTMTITLSFVSIRFNLARPFEFIFGNIALYVPYVMLAYISYEDYILTQKGIGEIIIYTLGILSVVGFSLYMYFKTNTTITSIIMIRIREWKTLNSLLAIATILFLMAGPLYLVPKYYANLRAKYAIVGKKGFYKISFSFKEPEKHKDYENLIFIGYNKNLYFVIEKSDNCTDRPKGILIPESEVTEVTLIPIE